MTLGDIRERLRELASDDVRVSAMKFVPTATRMYGIRVPVLNEIARECAVPGLGTVTALWESGVYEERLLGAKLLGRIAGRDPEQVWQAVQRMAPTLTDWPTCDTLGTVSVRPLLRKMGPTIANTATLYCAEEEEWLRRFGLVLLTNFAKDTAYWPRLESVLTDVSKDKRAYVRKAADWLRRDMEKAKAKQTGPTERPVSAA